MKLGVLFSGGKDSFLALHRGMQDNDIRCLITLKSQNLESYMFHTPNIHLTHYLSQAVDIPLVTQRTEGNKEKELKDLETAFKRAKEEYLIEGIITGTLASTYQSTRVQSICRDQGLWCFNPLWMKDPLENLRTALDIGLEVIIVGIYAYPLKENLLGRAIDHELLSELMEMEDRYSINPSGEGGEIETLVIDGPMFRSRLKVLRYEKHYHNYSGVMEIPEVELIEK